MSPFFSPSPLPTPAVLSFSLRFSLGLTMYSQLIEFVESTCALLGPRCRPCPIFLRNGRVVVGVTFDISSVNVRRCGGAPPSSSSSASTRRRRRRYTRVILPSFLVGERPANDTARAATHPRLSIIMHAIQRDGFRMGDDDGARSSRARARARPQHKYCNIHDINDTISYEQKW